MKHLQLIGFFTIILSSVCFSQSKISEDGNFKIDSGADSYYLSGVVKVLNGKAEDVDVSFSATIAKDAWDNSKKLRGMSDQKYFELVGKMLSMSAQNQLKNNLSFEPFPKQYFSWLDTHFESHYKLAGRNGYGNLTETTVLAFYDPTENPTGIKSEGVKPKTVRHF